MKRRGFTIVELLISIAIIGMLLSILVTSVHRTLQKNDIADDADIFTAKAQEVKTMAASYQQDNSAADTQYYGLYVPKAPSDHFWLIRLSALGQGGPNHCQPQDIINADLQSHPDCFLEKVNFASDDTLVNTATDRFLLFKTPTQQLAKITQSGSSWVETSPVYNGDTFFGLTLANKQANVVVSDYTGAVSVNYKQ